VREGVVSTHAVKAAAAAAAAAAAKRAEEGASKVPSEP